MLMSSYKSHRYDSNFIHKIKHAATVLVLPSLWTCIISRSVCLRWFDDLFKNHQLFSQAVAQHYTVSNYTTFVYGVTTTYGVICNRIDRQATVAFLKRRDEVLHPEHMMPKPYCWKSYKAKPLPSFYSVSLGTFEMKGVLCFVVYSPP